MARDVADCDECEQLLNQKARRSAIARVTFAVPTVEPQITDKLVIDGAERVITNLTPIPPAGTVVAYKAWCAA